MPGRCDALDLRDGTSRVHPRRVAGASPAPSARFAMGLSRSLVLAVAGRADHRRRLLNLGARGRLGAAPPRPWSAAPPSNHRWSPPEAPRAPVASSARSARRSERWSSARWSQRPWARSPAPAAWCPASPRPDSPSGGVARQARGRRRGGHRGRRRRPVVGAVAAGGAAAWAIAGWPFAATTGGAGGGSTAAAAMTDKTTSGPSVVVKPMMLSCSPGSRFVGALSESWDRQSHRQCRRLEFQVIA